MTPSPFERLEMFLDTGPSVENWVIHYFTSVTEYTPQFEIDFYSPLSVHNELTAATLHTFNCAIMTAL